MSFRAGNWTTATEYRALPNLFCRRGGQDSQYRPGKPSMTMKVDAVPGVVFAVAQSPENPPSRGLAGQSLCTTTSCVAVVRVCRRRRRRKPRGRRSFRLAASRARRWRLDDLAGVRAPSESSASIGPGIAGSFLLVRTRLQLWGKLGRRGKMQVYCVENVRNALDSPQWLGNSRNLTCSSLSWSHNARRLHTPRKFAQK